jgi:4-azaleucine resistance transporter AzlC
MPSSHTHRSEFWAGVKATIPLIVGVIPFGIIFGAVAVTSGVSPIGAMGMSLFVFAGSAQFIAAGLVGQGAGIAIIVITAFIVNLRHALYSASLAPYMRRLSQKWLLPLGFWLTDETYAVVIGHYAREDGSPYKHWFHLGSALLMYTCWNASTLVGILAGQAIHNPQEWGLDYAIVVTFIGIVIPLIRSKPMLIAALVAGATAVLAQGLPNKLGLMLAALLGIMAGMIAESYLPTTEAKFKQRETEGAKT